MKSPLPTLALFVATLASAALVGEAVLRVRVGAPTRWRHPQERYVHDPEIGHWLEPGQHSFTYDQVVDVNSHGLRDREFAPEPPPGVRRVLALGDSQTFGNGLALDDTWPKQLERRLLERDPDRTWEVVNAGLPASGTWQHQLMLERLDESYAPDIAILGFYVNDVRVRPDRGSRQMEAGLRTHGWSRRVGYWLKRSALVTATAQARHAITAALSSRGGPDWETRIVIGEPNAKISAAWIEVERSLTAMRDFAAARDIGLVVLMIPRRDQVRGDRPETAFQQQLAGIASDLELPGVDALEALHRAHDRLGRALFIAWDGHNSASANAVIADLLADALIDGSLRTSPRRAAREGDESRW